MGRYGTFGARYDRAGCSGSEAGCWPRLFGLAVIATEPCVECLPRHGQRLHRRFLSRPVCRCRACRIAVPGPGRFTTVRHLRCGVGKPGAAADPEYRQIPPPGSDHHQSSEASGPDEQNWARAANASACRIQHDQQSDMKTADIERTVPGRRLGGHVAWRRR